MDCDRQDSVGAGDGCSCRHRPPLRRERLGWAAAVVAAIILGAAPEYSSTVPRQPRASHPHRHRSSGESHAQSDGRFGRAAGAVARRHIARICRHRNRRQDRALGAPHEFAGGARAARHRGRDFSLLVAGQPLAGIFCRWQVEDDRSEWRLAAGGVRRATRARRRVGTRRRDPVLSEPVSAPDARQRHRRNSGCGHEDRYDAAHLASLAVFPARRQAFSLSRASITIPRSRRTIRSTTRRWMDRKIGRCSARNRMPCTPVDFFCSRAATS